MRILDAAAAEVEFTFDVIPGITAVQALTARHRIPLNEVGEPVLNHYRPSIARPRTGGCGGGDARRGLLVCELPA
ncbi:SAM-dependent methyltransferase [Mycobacterium tilburgii]|uniref:SAM-dependent methyltransferase n=1 Tax=Mycobacterium tilburgii TaxID=44467 RepID=UPI0021B47E39|nr:SAM-dependent methyltransferase [Mycobacterium tilburgii]